MFTIEVEKRKKDESFGFEDLKMFHQECLGGKIKTQTEEAPLWLELAKGVEKLQVLTCQRCKAKIEIGEGIHTIEIIKTSIDGKERKLGTDIRIVQKT